MITTFDRLKSTFESTLKWDLTLETTFEELFLCPLDMFHLICAIEDEFKIKIDDNVVEEIKTISQIVNLIDTQLSEVANAA